MVHVRRRPARKAAPVRGGRPTAAAWAAVLTAAASAIILPFVIAPGAYGRWGAPQAGAMVANPTDPLAVATTGPRPASVAPPARTSSATGTGLPPTHTPTTSASRSASPPASRGQVQLPGPQPAGPPAVGQPELPAPGASAAVAAPTQRGRSPHTPGSPRPTPNAHSTVGASPGLSELTIPTSQTPGPDPLAGNGVDKADRPWSLPHNAALGHQLFVAGLITLLLAIGGLVTVGLRRRRW